MNPPPTTAILVRLLHLMSLLSRLRIRRIHYWIVNGTIRRVEAQQYSRNEPFEPFTNGVEQSAFLPDFLPDNTMCELRHSDGIWHICVVADAWADGDSAAHTSDASPGPVHTLEEYVEQWVASYGYRDSCHAVALDNRGADVPTPSEEAQEQEPEQTYSLQVSGVPLLDLHEASEAIVAAIKVWYGVDTIYTPEPFSELVHETSGGTATVYEAQIAGEIDDAQKLIKDIIGELRNRVPNSADAVFKIVVRTDDRLIASYDEATDGLLA